MEEEHREILRRYWSELRKDLEPIKLLPWLVCVLDPFDIQDIKAEVTREKQTDKLLDLLPRRGPKAFDEFVRALKYVQPFLAPSLLQDSDERMKQELGAERARSASVFKELRKTTRELEELKSTLQALLGQTEAEKQDILSRASELENANKETRCDETARPGEGLKAEREKCEALREEIARWKKNLSGRVFNYTKDFDKLGVIYALATNFGTTPWVNPSSPSSDLTRIIVTRSSDDQGEATDLLEHKKGNLSCTKDVDRSWWCVDLSEKYALFLTHYTLRHGRDDRLSLIRNWHLEGSLDGCSWRLLRKHDKDHKLIGSHPYCTATWSVEGEVGAFRYFRILQTGKNSNGRFAVYLSGIEFYGILLEMSHS